jgi:hypothetical protein
VAVAAAVVAAGSLVWALRKGKVEEKEDSREQTKAQPQPGGGGRDKELADFESRITALQAEADAMDKEMEAVLSLLQEWAKNHRSDVERAAKIDPVLGFQVVTKSAALAESQVKDLINAREKFRREHGQILKDRAAKKK